MPVKKSVSIVFFIALLLAIVVSAYSLNDVFESNEQYYDEFYQNLFFGDNAITGAVVAGQEVVATPVEPPTSCGNGVRDSGEQCELNSDCQGGEFCRFDCTCIPFLSVYISSKCGNGNRDLGEECGEPGLTCPGITDSCSNCKCLGQGFVNQCGNGNKDPGEECGEPGLTCPNADQKCEICKCVDKGDADGGPRELPDFIPGSNPLWIEVDDSYISHFRTVENNVDYVGGGAIFFDVPAGYDFMTGQGSGLGDPVAAHRGRIGNFQVIRGKGATSDSYVVGKAETSNGGSQAYVVSDAVRVNPGKTWISLDFMVMETAGDLTLVRLKSGQDVVGEVRLEGNSIVFDADGSSVSQSLGGGWNHLEISYGTSGSSLGSSKMNTPSASVIDRVEVGIFGAPTTGTSVIEFDNVVVSGDRAGGQVLESFGFDETTWNDEVALMVSRDFGEGAWFVVSEDISGLLSALQSSSFYNELEGVVVDLDTAGNPSSIINGVRGIDGSLKIGVKVQDSANVNSISVFNPDVVVVETDQAVDESTSADVQLNGLLGTSVGFGTGTERTKWNNVVQTVSAGTDIYVLPTFIDNELEGVNENYNVNAKSIFHASAITESVTSSMSDVNNVHVVNRFSSMVGRDAFYRFRDDAKLDFESDKIASALMFTPFTRLDTDVIQLGNVIEDISYNGATIPEITAFVGARGYLGFINRLNEVVEIKVSNTNYDTVGVYRYGVRNFLGKDVKSNVIDRINEERYNIQGDYVLAIAPGFTMVRQSGTGDVIVPEVRENICEGTSFLPFFSFDTRYGCKVITDARLAEGKSPCVYKDTITGGKCETLTQDILAMGCGYWGDGSAFSLDPVSCEISAYSNYPACQANVDANACVSVGSPLFQTGVIANGVLSVTLHIEDSVLVNDGKAVGGLQYSPAITSNNLVTFMSAELGQVVTDLKSGGGAFEVMPTEANGLLFGLATFPGFDLSQGGEIVTFRFSTTDAQAVVDAEDVIVLDVDGAQAPIANVQQITVREAAATGDYYIEVGEIVNGMFDFNVVTLRSDLTGIQFRAKVSPDYTVNSFAYGQGIGSAFSVPLSDPYSLAGASALGAGAVMPGGVMGTYSASVNGGATDFIIELEEAAVIINGVFQDVVVTPGSVGGVVIPPPEPRPVPTTGLPPADLNDLDSDGVGNDQDCAPLNSAIGGAGTGEICLDGMVKQIVCPDLDCSNSDICIDGMEASYPTSQPTTFNPTTGLCEPMMCDPISMDPSQLCALEVCTDNDGDGFGDGCANGPDCDDGNALVNPGMGEICDGLDNDCNNVIDDRNPVCECLNGEVDDTCGISNVGACSFGSRSCVSGIWTDCVGEILPGTEVCDGADNDCDGSTDEGFTSSPTVCGVGACASTGSVVCQAGGEVDTCQPGTPGTEVCDLSGIDEDCDGQVNEGCDCIDGDTQQCGTSDVGACKLGTQTCSGGQWGSCEGDVSGSTEVCDGIDNDCDGVVDESVTGGTTTCGIGACASTGQMECQNGNMVDTCQAGSGSTEVCDGIDNDCDGVVDNGNVCAPPPQCTDGEQRDCGATDVGVCAFGLQTCVSGAWATCEGEIGADASETCGDGLDNDCNGVVDDVDQCSASLDDDSDGVINADDRCPGTVVGTPVNANNGCPTYSGRKEPTEVGVGRGNNPNYDLDLEGDLTNVPPGIRLISSVLPNYEVEFTGVINLLHLGDIINFDDLIDIASNRITIRTDDYAQFQGVPGRLRIRLNNVDHPALVGLSRANMVVLRNGVECGNCVVDNVIYRKDISITTNQFPSEVRVRPETIVTWTNDDSVDHTITASDGSFDQTIQPGESFSFTFPNEGETDYTCTIHPEMIGKIVVTNDGSADIDTADVEFSVQELGTQQIGG